MCEAFAFICGLVAMGTIWFINDFRHNPYMRGYADGLRDGINEVMSDFTKLEKVIKHE